MANTLNMTVGKPTRLLLLFAMPLMFSNMFQQFYTVVDTAIVGRGVGMDALAALGTVDWLSWMVLGIAQGFTAGFSVRMSQKFGEGDFTGLRRVIGLSARLTIVITLLTAILSQIALPGFLYVLRVPSGLTHMATLYVRIIFAGIPCMMFFNFTASVLRAVGNSRTPLFAMITASIFNIALDALVVFYFHWGIAGAAAATVFAQTVAGGICAYRIVNTPHLRFRLSDMVRDGEMAKMLMRLGAPLAIQNTIISIGGMVVSAVVNGFGNAFIAGFTATNKLYGLLEIAATSYGFAVTTYVGQNFGAGNLHRIRIGVRSAVLLAAFTSAVISGVMIGFGRWILQIFIDREAGGEALAAAYRYLVIMSAFLLILYFLYVYRSALQGMGDTIIPMLSGVAEFFMRIAIAILCGILAQENDLFYAEPAAWIGAVCILIPAYYIRLKKAFQKKEAYSEVQL